MAKNPNWTRDELILALDLYMSAGRSHLSANHPDVMLLSQLLNRLPIHGAEQRQGEFRNPAGISMKLGNFLRLDPTYEGVGLQGGSKLDQEVWDDYAENLYELRSVARAIQNSYHDVLMESSESYNLDNEEFREGRILTRLHLQKERNSKVVERKKAQVLDKFGRLACEVCGFDFAEVYGELGVGFAECHHLIPLAELDAEVKTRLSDLAIVCANCHRMLHHGPTLLTIEALRTRLQADA